MATETQDFAEKQTEMQNVKSNHDEGKTTAIIAYITIIGLIIAFVKNNKEEDPFASFHIRQMLGISVTGLALTFINIIPILGTIISLIGILLIIILWIVGLISAVNGEEKKVPILGAYYQEWFKGIN